MDFFGVYLLDPKNFRVNLRFLSNKSLPKVVRESMESLQAQVSRESQETGWDPGKKDRLGGSFIFQMSDLRADLDGPAKRVLDSLSKGLGVNDGKFDELHFYRAKGDPKIVASVWVIGTDPGPYRDLGRYLEEEKG